MADVQTQNPQIEAHALARHVRLSPQKARLVIDLIRGQKVQDALQTLRFTPKRAAKHIEKVLRSAVANAGKRLMTQEHRSTWISSTSRKRSSMKVRAGRGCGPRRWAAHSATRSVRHISGLALLSIMLQRQSAMRQTSPNRNRTRAFAEPRVVSARL